MHVHNSLKISRKMRKKTRLKNYEELLNRVFCRNKYTSEEH